MGRKLLSIVEITKALTLLGQGISILCLAAELKVSRQAIYDLKKAATTILEGVTPPCMPGSGRKRLTSSHMDRMLKREVIANHLITAASLKKKHP